MTSPASRGPVGRSAGREADRQQRHHQRHGGDQDRGQRRGDVLLAHGDEQERHRHLAGGVGGDRPPAAPQPAQRPPPARPAAAGPPPPAPPATRPRTPGGTPSSTATLMKKYGTPHTSETAPNSSQARGVIGPRAPRRAATGYSARPSARPRPWRRARSTGCPPAAVDAVEAVRPDRLDHGPDRPLGQRQPVGGAPHEGDPVLTRGHEDGVAAEQHPGAAGPPGPVDHRAAREVAAALDQGDPGQDLQRARPGHRGPLGRPGQPAQVGLAAAAPRRRRRGSSRPSTRRSGGGWR